MGEVGDALAISVVPLFRGRGPESQEGGGLGQLVMTVMI